MECEVSYVDSERITHSVTVWADSLFEACNRAVAAFRKSALSELGRPSEMTVKVSQPAITFHLAAHWTGWRITDGVRRNSL
jgi:hypothetical protein